LVQPGFLLPDDGREMMNNGKGSGKGVLVGPGFFLTIMVMLVMLLAGQATCFANNVTLQWDADTDPGVIGYKVYYQADSSTEPFTGTGSTSGASPINVSNVTSATINGLDPSRVYYFAVTAYNAAGVESAYSNVVSTPTSIVQGNVLKGDVNGDGVVDVTDALVVMQAVTNPALQTPAMLTSADVSPLDSSGKPVGDGQITLADALLILQKAVGLINW
jgi:hypothetical protein